MLRRLATLLALVFLLATAACGGDDDSPGSSVPSGDAGAGSVNSASDANKDKGADQNASQAPSGVSGDGVIVVNGESHDVERILRCEPDLDFVLPESLDLGAVADNGQLQLLINVDYAEQLVPTFSNGNQTGYENKALQSQSIDLQGAAANGLWNGGASQSVVPPNPEPAWYGGGDFKELDGPPITVSGDKISGAMTLDAFDDSGATVDVSFEFTIPSDAVDCRLR